MDFKQYQYVLKVAELQNMTKAAKELYVTQPSLSHFIAKVEEELGTPIFNRETSPISLTTAGEKYVETARMVMELNDRLKNEVADLANSKKGTIKVGISHARGSFFLPYVLPEFWQEYPGIEVKTVEEKSEKIEDDVMKGVCNLGIIPLPPCSDYDFDQTVLCREELLLVTGHELPESQFSKKTGNNYVNWKTLRDHPYVLLKRGHGIRSAIDVLFQEHHITPKRVFETTSNETAFRLSSVDIGFSIVPMSTILLSKPLDNIYLYSIGEEGFYWEVGAITRQKEYLTAAQKDLISLLQDTFENFDWSVAHEIEKMKNAVTRL